MGIASACLFVLCVCLESCTKVSLTVMPNRVYQFLKCMLADIKKKNYLETQRPMATEKTLTIPQKSWLDAKSVMRSLK